MPLTRYYRKKMTIAYLEAKCDLLQSVILNIFLAKCQNRRSTNSIADFCNQSPARLTRTENHKYLRYDNVCYELWDFE